MILFIDWLLAAGFNDIACNNAFVNTRVQALTANKKRSNDRFYKTNYAIIPLAISTRHLHRNFAALFFNMVFIVHIH
jgi:hypothetical protein